MYVGVYVGMYVYRYIYIRYVSKIDLISKKHNILVDTCI